jgi:hypothetical protein
VDPAKEAVVVVEEDSEAVEAVEAEAVEAAMAEVVAVEVEEVAANQQQQQHQLPTHRGTDLKEYHPPYFEGIPSYSTRSNKNGDYTGPPTSTTKTSLFHITE